MNWVHAIRHVARETTAGFRGGLVDVRYVRGLAPEDGLKDEEKAYLLRYAGIGERANARLREEWADLFGMAKRRREIDEENRRVDAAAEDWLEDQAQWSPGLQELSRVGDRPLDEFHAWMTRPHGWLSVEDDVWPREPGTRIAP